MDRDIKHDAKLFVQFVKRVNKTSERPIPNIYLVKSPTKFAPKKLMWRVKRQCGGCVFMKQFSIDDKDSAINLANEIRRLSNAEFLNMHRYYRNQNRMGFGGKQIRF